MALFLLRRWRLTYGRSFPLSQSFRSNAAMEALAKASEEKTPNIALYNYPSFSGAFSALFAHLFHSHLHLPCLVLPFSSVEPLRKEVFSLFSFVIPLSIVGLKICASKDSINAIFLIFLGREDLRLNFRGELRATGNDPGVDECKSGAARS
ncbi:hypothetical protein U1Q18_004127 [Sarracenia purpurea var. burkii]